MCVVVELLLGVICAVVVALGLMGNAVTVVLCALAEKQINNL